MAKEPSIYLLSDKAQAILKFVREHDEEYTSNEISDALGTDFVSHRAAVGTINSLVKKGLVEREVRSEEDGTQVKVVLPTAKGKEFDLKTSNPRHAAWEEAEAAKAAKKAKAKEEPVGADENITF